ncbi:MAG: amidohydrolase [Cytophagales bacterium]|nr:amidohydrolase [Cytophagales bacterium]
MKYLFTVTLVTVISLSTYAQKLNKQLFSDLESKKQSYEEASMKIWYLAEVGYQEEKSSKVLQELLKNEGFKIEAGVSEIPTAFVATYGSGEPVIGIMGEYDALPGISQKAVSYKEPLTEGGAGHACGHHLFGVASAAAAIAAKNWLAQNGGSGTIKFYGTPAEEGGSGKVYMARAGLFDDCDAVLHWHPGDGNGASPSTTLANKTGKFRFYGVSAHASGAPERGRSALDAVEAMNFMVNMMREHTTEDTRIHYVITSGGKAPNVVPDFAEVYYYVRHPDPQEVKSLWQRLENAANGAALGTDTEVEIEVTGGVYNVLPNETLQRIVHENLTEVGGFDYTADEAQFAEEISKSLGKSAKPLNTTNEVASYQYYVVKASTDVGDVSWTVPTAGMRAATWVPGTAAHSWQAVAAGGTSIGQKGMMVAAKTLALTIAELIDKPAVLAKVQEEFEASRGSDFVYEALVGDRGPALDYRK